VAAQDEIELLRRDHRQRLARFCKPGEGRARRLAQKGSVKVRLWSRAAIL
jgi:hypothetical protein